MKEYKHVNILLFSLLLLLMSLFNVVNSKIHGVHDKDAHLYENENLSCPKNGKKLTIEMINDGICDCPDDGFDEPGTAACENGKFFCKNLTKNLEKYIPSFKVNDGVCDCCDGSDEYLNNFGMKCDNTCDTLISVQRREAYLEKAKIAKAKKYYDNVKQEVKLKQEELKEKLEKINQKIEELNEKSEIVDNPENIESFLADYRQKLDQLEFLISNLTITETAKYIDSNDKQEENNKSTWRTLIDIRLKRAKDIISKFASITSNKPTTTTTTTVTKYLPTIVTKTVVQYEPTTATTSYDDKNQDSGYEKDELLAQARKIEEGMNNPEIYGPDSVFLVLKDKCFDAQDGKFSYSLCWFDEIKQNSHMIVGKWNGEWGETVDKDGHPVKDYKHMIYSDGHWCGSKARESHVLLQCGWSNHIISVSESTTCTYVFKFSTPLACIL